MGYYEDLDERSRSCLEYAVGANEERPINWSLLEAVWDSGAVLAMTTVPDLLGLGSEARFNTPGEAAGNWRWRVTADQLTDDVADRLGEITRRNRRAR